MLIDFNQAPASSLPKNADVCVVGSGPAGMTVALELNRYGKSVILLEGGGVHLSLESQELYQGDVIGDHYVPLDAARLRYLGGTSGHWGGWSYPLTPYTFEEKIGFENAHWPIEKKDLDPFFERALAVLDIKPPADEVVLDRTPNPHLGFGAGAHRCIGSFVAKLELRVALEAGHQIVHRGDQAG